MNDMTAHTKEYKSSDGSIQLRVEFDKNRVLIEQPDENISMTISEPQARWLGTELDSQFGGGPKDSQAFERVVFFTGVVTEDSVVRVQRELLKLAYKEKESKKPQHITLMINSPGGACNHGFALVDTIEYIRGMGVPVVGIVNGVAMSMGSVLLQACSSRLISRHSRLMVHEISAGVQGKLHNIRNEVEEFERVMWMLAQVYAERNTSDKKTPEEWVAFLEGQDKYISAAEAVKLGLCDAIYEPLKNWDVAKLIDAHK
jgi:ATP-dependent Clp protease, protease subunit